MKQRVEMEETMNHRIPPIYNQDSVPFASWDPVLPQPILALHEWERDKLHRMKIHKLGREYTFAFGSASITCMGGYNLSI